MPKKPQDSEVALAAPSIDPAEVEKFSRIAAAWWDPRGKFKPLHEINPLRLDFIREKTCAALGRDPSADRPLQGLRALDVGCGGGLIAEPIARLGARLTAIDASEANIKTARVHAGEVGLDIDYRVGSVEALIAAGEAPYELVTCLEVVEHVADPAAFVAACARLVAPGGLLVLSTINRTPKAFALAIIGAEYVLRLLPVGTHDYSKFLTPAELAEALRDPQIAVDPPVGMVLNPFLWRWSLSSDASVNYLLTARRAA